MSILLDYLDGDAIEPSRLEPGQSGPGPAGYDLCLSCPGNHALGHRVCPDCNGTRLVKARDGAYDPYLPLFEGAVQSGSHDDLSGPQPIKFETPDGPIDREHAKRQREIEPPPVQAHVKLTQVESAASRLIAKQRLLGSLVYLLSRAPRWVKRGINSRDQASLEWLGTRMSTLPDALIH